MALGACLPDERALSAARKETATMVSRFCILPPRWQTASCGGSVGEPSARRSTRPAAALAIAAVAFFWFACTGRIDSSAGATGASGVGGTGTGPHGGTSGGVVGATDTTVAPGPATIRRLTNDEWRRTVQALLGLPMPRTDAFEADPINKAGFDNFASDLSVSPTLATRQAAMVAELAKSFAAPPCAGGDEPACAKSFITSFGKRAFRRPLGAAEIDRYAALYADERTRGPHAQGISQIVETMLQSPHFLYRFELGVGTAGSARRLTAYEVASALSYLFTGSMPDEALFVAADANQLQTAAQLEAQARRLLALPAARERLRGFLTAYAGITRLDEQTKSADVYPAFTPELRGAMRTETERFIDDVLAGEGTFKALLTAPSSYVNASLARLYGLPNPPGDAAAFTKTTLDPAQRMGLLTHASVLAAHAKADESSPVLRGKFIRVGLLCQSLPAPPKVVPKPPQPTADATTRERFAQHSSDPACTGCHKLIDPLGFGLERYDGIGAWRASENGKPVDARGEMTGTADVDGPYDGGIELAKKLAASADARRCLALQAYRWANGRFELDGERDVVARIEQALAPAGLRIADVLVAIATADNFTRRTLE
jgi:hypothetical protein